MNIHDWTLHHRLWFVGIMIVVSVVVFFLTIQVATSWVPWDNMRPAPLGPPSPSSEDSGQRVTHQLDASIEYLNVLEELGVE